VDVDYIREVFADFGAVQVRRMFGGAGLYAEGVMFGLVSGGEIYLKADAASVADFQREGCRPFEYGGRTGRRTIMSYWRMPDRLYDDAEELAQWARIALAVAQRSASAKSRRNPVRKKKRSG
jgi:DNA transformation protein and related proteins